MEKMTYFCSFDEFRITNRFIMHKDIHKFKWQARNTKSVRDYTTENEKWQQELTTYVSIGI
jgi:hypothetical protein